MNSYRLSLLLLSIYVTPAVAADTLNVPNVLIVPYQSAMHMSDADISISMQSEMDIDQVRKALREGIVRDLRTQLAGNTKVEVLRTDHVGADDNDEQTVYRALYYEQDTVWTVLHPVKDTTQTKKRSYMVNGKKPTEPKDIKYINVGFHDQQLLSELGRQYGSDVIVFLNELDIKTSSKDCIDLAKHIYDRTLRLHYSVFDTNSRQLYGDVAVVHITSATNDVDEIIYKHIPSLTAQVMQGIRNR